MTVRSYERENWQNLGWLAAPRKCGVAPFGGLDAEISCAAVVPHIVTPNYPGSQVKQQGNKGSQRTNLESQLQKQAPGAPPIFDEIQQNEREATPSTNGRTYAKTTGTME